MADMMLQPEEVANLHGASIRTVRLSIEPETWLAKVVIVRNHDMVAEAQEFGETEKYALTKALARAIESTFRKDG